MKRKQLGILVEDSPGVLTHVAGLISRRGYNIESIAASKTETPGMTRISVILQIEEDWQLEQVMAQISKLVQVFEVIHLSKGVSISRELALIKVKSTVENRHEIMAIVEVFGGKILEFNEEIIVIELSHYRQKINSFCSLMNKYGILEITRTGEIIVSNTAETKQA